MIEIAPVDVTATDLAPLAAPVEGAGVRVSPAAPLSRWSLRARAPEVLAEAIGRELPMRIGDVLGGIVRLGPDEWLAMLPEGSALPSGAGAPVSIVEVSARAAGLVVEGPAAAALIATGCPLDLDRFAAGRATRTVYETVEILLWRKDAAVFHIDVWRSFAPWLSSALAAAIRG